MDFDRFTTAFLVAWVVGALASLGIAGVIVWAIVRLVNKYL